MDKDLFYKMIKKNLPDEALMPIQAGSYATMNATDLMLNFDMNKVSKTYNQRHQKKLKFDDVAKIGDTIFEVIFEQAWYGNEIELGRKDRTLMFEVLTKDEKLQLKVGNTCFGFPLNYIIKLPTLKGSMLKVNKVYGVPVDKSWVIFKKDIYEKNLS